MGLMRAGFCKQLQEFLKVQNHYEKRDNYFPLHLHLDSETAYKQQGPCRNRPLN